MNAAWRIFAPVACTGAIVIALAVFEPFAGPQNVGVQVVQSSVTDPRTPTAPAVATTGALVMLSLSEVGPSPMSVSDDQADLPWQLQAFLKSLDQNYLIPNDDTAISLHQHLTGSPASWRGIADRLEGDELAAKGVIVWLANQRQPGAFVALAAFGGRLAELGLGPKLSSNETESMVRAVSFLDGPQSAMDLLMLAQQTAIPDYMLVDLRNRLQVQQGLRKQFESLVTDSAGPQEVADLLSLGGDETPWNWLHSSTLSRIPQVREAAIEAISVQVNTMWLEGFTTLVAAGGGDLAVEVAKQWSMRQLSGDRLLLIDRWLSNPNLSQGELRLAQALLQNAEARDEATELALRRGISLSSTQR